MIQWLQRKPYMLNPKTSSYPVSVWDNIDKILCLKTCSMPRVPNAEFSKCGRRVKGVTFSRGTVLSINEEHQV